MEVVPFAEEHLDAAAELLAARHEAHRRVFPQLPEADYRAEIAALLEQGATGAFTEGAYVLGALSGFGVMGSHAGADLLATHLTGGQLPDYARWFLPSRYEDEGYRAEIQRWGSNLGQL